MRSGYVEVGFPEPPKQPDHAKYDWLFLGTCIVIWIVLILKPLWQGGLI